jgi:hypothetical protein
MNIENDRITRFKTSHHRLSILYECLGSCRFQANSQATFLNHKVTKKCISFNGDWFFKMKKKGMKDYHHIIHRYYWDKIMMNIRK